MQHIIGAEHQKDDVWLRLHRLVIVTGLEVGVGAPLWIEDNHIFDFLNKPAVLAKVDKFVLLAHIVALQYLSKLIWVASVTMLGPVKQNAILEFIFDKLLVPTWSTTLCQWVANKCNSLFGLWFTS